VQLTIYIVACLGALFLIASAVAWWRICRDPRDDLLVEGPQSARVKPAARLTAMALFLSGIAAIGAIIEWFLGQMLVY
jgi:hypothetical protein